MFPQAEGPPDVSPKQKAHRPPSLTERAPTGSGKMPPVPLFPAEEGEAPSPRCMAWGQEGDIWKRGEVCGVWNVSSSDSSSTISAAAAVRMVAPPPLGGS